MFVVLKKKIIPPSAATEETDALSMWSTSGSQLLSIVHKCLGGFCYFKVYRPSHPRLHCHSEQPPCKYLCALLIAFGIYLKL